MMVNKLAKKQVLVEGDEITAENDVKVENKDVDQAVKNIIQMEQQEAASRAVPPAKQAAAAAPAPPAPAAAPAPPAPAAAAAPAAAPAPAPTAAAAPAKAPAA